LSPPRNLRIAERQLDCGAEQLPVFLFGQIMTDRAPGFIAYFNGIVETFKLISKVLVGDNPGHGSPPAIVSNESVGIVAAIRFECKADSLRARKSNSALDELRLLLRRAASGQ
jgi:hypothetical protein